MVSYLTGLEMESLCARLDKFGEGRVLDDNASIMVNFKGGAKGLYWSSQIAVGHDNGFRVRIYGTKASLDWLQEDCNHCRVSLSRQADGAPLPRPGPDVRPGPVPLPHSVRPSRGLFRSVRQHLFASISPPSRKKKAGEPLTREDLDFPERRGRDPGRPVHREMRRKLDERGGLGQILRPEKPGEESAMSRPVTLFTGQWADLPFEEVCKKASAWGYDGLEIACWGDHMDVRTAAAEPGLRQEEEDRS